MSRNRWFGSVATLAVFIGLALGIRRAGLPSLQRRVAADYVRLSDLDALSTRIHTEFLMSRQIPQDVAALRDVNPGLRLRDPETGRSYEYRPLDAHHYELCAVFATVERGAMNSRMPSNRPHGAGRQCFKYLY